MQIINRYRSVGEQLKLANGRPSGFDYMRIILALSVILIHSYGISYGPTLDADLWASPLKPFMKITLPMFFALSGFLVAGSFERCRTIWKFLALRAIRIFPALLVEVLLSAFILGPILTNLSLSDYFKDPLLINYLWNIIGHVQFYLPGLFANNHTPGMVNGQLWTVPFELFSYISLVAIWVLGLKNFKILAPVAALSLVSMWLLYHYYKSGGLPVEGNGRVSGAILVSCFLAGVSIYLFRFDIVYSSKLFIISIVLSILMLYYPYFSYLAVFPIAYATIWAGLTNFARIKLIKNADYSYGLFIYGYVIQQTVSSLMPWSNEWYINFPISVLFASIFSALSWNFVEKPFMRLKKIVDTIEERQLYRQSLAAKNVKI